jgi:hypothetical protein
MHIEINCSKVAGLIRLVCGDGNCVMRWRTEEESTKGKSELASVSIGSRNDRRSNFALPTSRCSLDVRIACKNHLLPAA